jgi:hypothetical protein
VLNYPCRYEFFQLPGPASVFPWSRERTEVPLTIQSPVVGVGGRKAPSSMG